VFVAKFVHNVNAEAGSVLSYEFRTRAHDIGFSLSYSPAPGAKPSMVVANERVASDKAVQTAVHMVPRTGIYTFTWDNSYSWRTGQLPLSDTLLIDL
jgi:hypothetical protein